MLEIFWHVNYLPCKFSLKFLFQSKIISELQNNGIHIYQFPTDDESVADINGTMNAHVPFAVVGSTDFVRVGNKMMRSRQYPWGTVQGKTIHFTRARNIHKIGQYVYKNIVTVENESHCDFVKLREMLISTNMEDMREKTHCRHYELYRKKRLEQVYITIRHKYHKSSLFLSLLRVTNF